MEPEGSVLIDVRCGTCGERMKLQGHKIIEGVAAASYVCLYGHGAADIAVRLESDQYDYSFAPEAHIVR